SHQSWSGILGRERDGRDHEGRGACAVAAGRLPEGAVSLPEKDREVARQVVCDGDVRLAVPVEVLSHRRDRTGIGTEGDALRERAISLAEEHADVVPFAVDDEQVQMA